MVQDTEKKKPEEILQESPNIDFKDVGIYLIYCSENKYGYIGHTKNEEGFVKRFRAHKNSLNRKDHGNRHLQAAWIKYGAEEFIFKPIENINRDLKLDYFVEREKYWIDLIPDNLLFNHIKDPVAYEISEETKYLMSLAQIERYKREPNPNKGAKYSEERRKSMSEQRIGKKLSPEQVANMKIIFAGENNPMYGRHHSPETIAKIKAKNIGRKMSLESREKMSKSRTGRIISEETIAKIVAKTRGIKRTPEQVAAMRARVYTEENRKNNSNAQKFKCARDRLLEQNINPSQEQILEEVHNRDSIIKECVKLNREGKTIAELSKIYNIQRRVLSKSMAKL